MSNMQNTVTAVTGASSGIGAEAALFALDQPPNVTVNDIVVHPTAQSW
jgi:NADP-dependent 3-hydroxy acid dehydrogenase YdfG